MEKKDFNLAYIQKHLPNWFRASIMSIHTMICKYLFDSLHFWLHAINWQWNDKCQVLKRVLLDWSLALAFFGVICTNTFGAIWITSSQFINLSHWLWLWPQRHHSGKINTVSKASSILPGYEWRISTSNYYDEIAQIIRNLSTLDTSSVFNQFSTSFSFLAIIKIFFGGKSIGFALIYDTLDLGPS